MADNDKGQAPAAAPQPAGTDPKPADAASKDAATAKPAETPVASEPKPKAPRASAPLKASPEDRMPPIHIHNNIPPAPQAQVDVKRGGSVGNILLGALVVMLVLFAGMFFGGYRPPGFSGSPPVASAPVEPVASIPLAPAQPTNLCSDKCRAQMVLAQCGPHRKVQFEHWPWSFEEFRQTLNTVCPATPQPVKAKAAPPPAPIPVVATDACPGGRNLHIHVWDAAKLPRNLRERAESSGQTEVGYAAKDHFSRGLGGELRREVGDAGLSTKPVNIQLIGTSGGGQFMTQAVSVVGKMTVKVRGDNPSQDEIIDHLVQGGGVVYPRRDTDGQYRLRLFGREWRGCDMNTHIVLR